MTFTARLLTLLSVLLAWSLTSAQQPEPASTLEKCLNLDETDIRGDINVLSQNFFEAEVNAVDLARIVDRKWFELGMPDLLQSEVNKAIDSVGADTGFTERVTSSFSPAQATALAEQIATRAFNSETFRNRLESLANEVAADFTRTFTTVAARSAGATTMCLQRYLGNVYGGAISSAFEEEVRLQIEETGAEALTQDFRPEGRINQSAVGVATIAGGYIARAVAQRLGTQISRRVAGNITARIVGRAGTSVIPIVGWAIGGGLIVFDVVTSGIRGPFPVIRRQLAGEETQQQIQVEIIASLREDLPEVSAELSAGISAEVYTQWEHFTQSFEGVLALAEDNAAFRQALTTTSEEDFYTLASVVELAAKDEIVQAAQQDQLNQVLQLGESTTKILESQPSLATVLEWSEVAGNRLEQVVNYEIYRHKTPADFSQRSLTRLLETDDFHTISALSLLDRDEMDALLKLSSPALNALSEQLRIQDFSTVAWYADALEPEARDAFIVRLLERPSRLEKFAPPSVRDAIVDSREPQQAVAFVGSEPKAGLFGIDLVQGFADDLASVAAGTVNMRLLSAKYPLGTLSLLSVLLVMVAVILVIVLIMLLWRLANLLRRVREKRG